MIIIRIWEGLGNQMFQYAYARALKEHGYDIRLDLNKSFDELFVSSRKHDIRKITIQNFRISIPSIDVYQYGRYNYLHQRDWYQKAVFWLQSHSLWKYRFLEEENPAFFEKVEKIKGNCFVKGWFQDERYFREIRPILLKEFTPRKRIVISKETREALEDLESVAVHIRRGDYVRLNNSLNSVYYQKAISRIKQVYRNPIFLVFSDELEWVKQNIPIEGRCIYVNENGRLQDYEELFIMSRCKANIIANSTFSWWAAWLNQNEEKIVIAPKKWGENIAPKDWILI